jgi:Domain of unknown function (DUF4160)
MGRLHTIGKIIITVYPNDHQPEHFHAVHPDFELQIEIETLMIMRGKPPAAAGRLWIGPNPTLRQSRPNGTESTRVIP